MNPKESKLLDETLGSKDVKSQVESFRFGF